jgi:ADP-dependent NAD(P)H-hydrate dehydratase / NAD(P)H-hydrate epimerase
MKVFKTSQIREIDEFTIKNEPILSVDLMERAALGCVKWFEKNIDREKPVAVFTGPGNNGGDGWAIARLLADRFYQAITVFQLQISRIISQDSEINRQRLISQGTVPIFEIGSLADIPQISPDTIIVDALFGAGLSRPLEGFSADLVNHLNNSGCTIISIDIPSGLMGEDNSGNPVQGIIRANVTLTFEFPKRSFLFAENEKYVGNWYIIPIGLHPQIINSINTGYYYTVAADVSGSLMKRNRFSHKGTFGHALLIAGSYGMAGAAVLAARACIRSGVGLLTSHVPRAIYPVIQGAVPESVFSIDQADDYFTNGPSSERFSAIAAGPGIGVLEQTAAALENLLRAAAKPMILDADALNILAAHPDMLELLPEKTIITPHPGEFDRLFGKSASGYQRNQRQIEVSEKFGIIVVLKGAYTSVSMTDGHCFFNSTGNPGMATAGSGDVLTGIILSLLAQGYSAEHAAVLGVYLHGLAGDLAAEDQSYPGLIASDIIHYIGKAFIKTENHEISLQQ